MSAYIHGNLALDDRQSNGSSSRKTKGAPKAAPRAKTITGQEKLLWIGMALFLFTILGIYLFREATKYEINSEIVKMEAEIRQLEEQNAMLKNEIAKLGSPERLIETGIQLGLVQDGAAPGTAAGDGTAVASAE